MNRRKPLVSDADLQRVTVGEREPHNARIRLDEYDPQWPELFRRERARIESALGAGAVRVEHVGSTSVPGLVGKADHRHPAGGRGFRG